jgi:hypothetical protein
MTIMTTTYLLVERRKNGCLGLDQTLGTAIGLTLGAAALGLFLWRLRGMGADDERPQLAPKPTEAERQSDNLAC